MNKIVLIATLSFFLMSNRLYSQIGIYTESPDPSAALDINSPSDDDSRGLLIPQMTTAQKEAIKNPAESLLVYDQDLNCISQNRGSETAPNWTCLTLFNRKFFYMPSINIDTKTLGKHSLDLFGYYQSQFESPMYKSLSAPASIPHFANARDLYYYVTYYNSDRIAIDKINADGIMEYTTIHKANYDDYINIVFVVK